MLSNGLGDVKREQQRVLTRMCHPPIGKPLASVLEHGYVARDCSGNPEMRMWPVWATELSVTFHLAMESNTNNAFPPPPTPPPPYLIAFLSPPDLGSL